MQQVSITVCIFFHVWYLCHEMVRPNNMRPRAVGSKVNAGGGCVSLCHDKQTALNTTYYVFMKKWL